MPADRRDPLSPPQCGPQKAEGQTLPQSIGTEPVPKDGVTKGSQGHHSVNLKSNSFSLPSPDLPASSACPSGSRAGGQGATDMEEKTGLKQMEQKPLGGHTEHTGRRNVIQSAPSRNETKETLRRKAAKRHFKYLELKVSFQFKETTVDGIKAFQVHCCKETLQRLGERRVYRFQRQKSKSRITA